MALSSSKKCLIASIFCCLLAFSSASYSPATSFVIKTCSDATYSILCLQTLLPSVDRINSTQKKSTRLAIMAAISSAQAVSNNTTQLANQPQLSNSEASSLKDCSSSISGSVSGLNTALGQTFHLGGGDKAAKETKRTAMVNNIKGVIGATNSCVQDLQAVNVRVDVLNNAQAAMQPLTQLATNAADLVRRMQF